MNAECDVYMKTEALRSLIILQTVRYYQVYPDFLDFKRANKTIITSLLVTYLHSNARFIQHSVSIPVQSI